ncbi:MAG: coiled-coil domain-containing protein [Microcystis sp.]|uniref:coiled-coil domain-containing protein n=1 Tax=Microcystis sp. TaxID=1127 RepID=UPI00391CD538
MSITVEVELKDFLIQINQKLDNLQKDVTDIKIELSEVKGEIKRLEEKIDGIEKRLEGKIDGSEKRLEGKIDGLEKRLENQEFVSRGILVALIVTILGGLAKLFGLVGSP